MKDDIKELLTDCRATLRWYATQEDDDGDQELVDRIDAILEKYGE